MITVIANLGPLVLTGLSALAALIGFLRVAKRERRLRPAALLLAILLLNLATILLLLLIDRFVLSIG